MRSILKHSAFIHFLVILGLFSLWGWIELQNNYLLLGISLSFLGAICGAFIKVVDEVRQKR